MRSKRKFNKTKEWLIEEYVIKNRPREEVAKECGMTVAGFKSLVASFGIKKDLKNINSIPDDVFIDLVNNQKLSVKQICEKLGFTDSSIYKRLKKLNLVILAEPIKYEQYDSTNDEEICELYKSGKSTTEIGKKFNLSHTTILKHLRHCGIKSRNFIESQWNYNGKIRPKEFDDYDFMYNLYVTQRKSKKELGDMYNCSPNVFDTVLTNLNIPIRGDSESKIGLMVGENHPNWKGGITSLYMRLREAFETQLTQKAMQKDNFCCQLCGSKKNLQVHHIVPFKKILSDIISEHPEYNIENNKEELYKIAVTDSRFLDLNNLVTYCKECHLFKIHGYNKRNNSQAQHKLPELQEHPEKENLQPSVSNNEGSTTICKEYIQANGSGEHLIDEEIVSSI